MGRPILSVPDRRHRGRRVLMPAIAALAVPLLAPAIASAHPLGNFTINHYAGLSIGRDGVDLDVVIDMAEIPTFQERQAMDTDGDGSVGDDEAAAWATTTCAKLVSDLHLALDGSSVPVVAGTGQATFLPGAGGLSILHLECLDRASFASALAGASRLTFSDSSWSERIGWREIVATGDGTMLDTHGLPATSPSAKLTAYPADLIAQPLDIRSASVDVTPVPALVTAASPPAVAAPATGQPNAVANANASAAAASAAAAVPGGVAGELPDILQASGFGPIAILLAIVAAAGLGAWHALTPGHGKTLLAAYLVGSRGTGVHAIGLGLSVAVSHTLGIVALALLVIGAQSVLAPDVVVRTTPVIAAVSVVAIGSWMLIGEARRRRATGRGSEDDHHHELAGDHDHEHAHGGVAHSHEPAAGSTLSWRGLFVLGLAGGLIPSTSALLILLGSIAAGRPAFGLVLVVAFGLGMAAVMTGVGLAMVFARTRLDRVPSRSSLGRLAGAAPLLASVAVLGLGVVLTWSAVAGRPVL